MDDFVIVEYNGEIGGRVKHTTFGKQPGSDEGYTIELGANWYVCGDAVPSPTLLKQSKGTRYREQGGSRKPHLDTGK